VSKAGGLCVFSELGRKRKQVGERKRPEMKCVLSALARSARCGGGRRNQQPDPVYIDAGKRGSGRRVGAKQFAPSRRQGPATVLSVLFHTFPALRVDRSSWD
jgi:hypothetical protein